jgi:hypothetical protein
LRALFPFHNFEFDFLTLLQGAKAFARNVAVVDKDIRPIFLGNKAISLGIAEPFDLASYSHGTVTSNKSCQDDRGGSGKKRMGTTESVPLLERLTRSVNSAYSLNFIK